MGRLISRDSGGKVRWQSDVTLSILESSPTAKTGFFELKKNSKSWDTPVTVRDGKAHMSFGFEERAFTLHQSGDSYVLESQYSSEWEGYPRKNVLELTKN